ncbi:hypothetical protein J2I47_19285 [Fibrella sp. HMF5335]|uniref:Uncharacterized protein n=1 Tax=Fibrella rubiginis TaxID=2817060 RepID=A0A939GLR1_9BACT|nr:hypothetical protein [Fibrella rubiginis]MBO0938703.1 hypothetical protein [Fibrella rubiginis]
MHVARTLGIRDINEEFEENKDIDVSDLKLTDFKFTDDELKIIGDYLFSYEATDFLLNEFIATSGFVTDKWFIDAYKRKSRERKEKISLAEARNWVNGVFEFLEEE